VRDQVESAVGGRSSAAQPEDDLASTIARGQK